MQGVLAAVEQDGAAVIVTAVGNDRIEHAVLLPDLRVPEIHHAAALRQVAAVDHRLQDLLVVHTVADGDALGLQVLHCAVRPAGGVDAGVHEQLPPVLQLQGAAGEAAVLVHLRIRRQRRRQPLPADEVLCLDVAPVHGAPVVGIGVVLEKKVVLSLVDGKAVGIVDPADGAGDMKG